MQKPSKHILSKTTFLYGCQCPKRLWLHKFRSHLRSAPDASTQVRWKRGHDVGRDAQKLFPAGIDMTPNSPSQYPQAVMATAEAIANGINVIYEATFQHEGVLIMLDILVRQDDGCWYGYEVKSSLEAKAIHIHDLALQSWVMWGSGLNLKKVHIIHLNPRYVRGSSLDLSGLFSIQDVTEQVQAWQDEIGEQVKRELTWLKATDEPMRETGAHCWEPYACDFAAYCGAKEPLPAIAPIPAIDYPACFVHLATVRPAVPLFEGQSPFQHITYGLSIVHVFATESAKQQSYLAPNWPVNVRVLVETLIHATESTKHIAVDSSSALPRLISVWKHQYPDLQEALTHCEQKLLKTGGWIDDDHPILMETQYGTWLRERNPDQKRLIEKQLRAHGIDLASKIKALFLTQ